MTLPAVTTGLLRRTSRPQLAIAVAGVGLALAVLVAPRAEPGVAEAPDAAAVLAADAVALHVPQSWLGAPLPPARFGDRVDVFAASAADRTAGAIVAASDARVLSLPGDGLVLALTADDAAALTVARARGYLLVVVLRPR